MTQPVHYHLNGFPPENIDFERILPLISEANRILGKYDGLLSAIPNPHILLTTLIVREAVLSSRIEGTNASVSDVLEYELGLLSEDDRNKQLDAQEVVNYREALIFASERIKDREFDFDLLLKSHVKLMEGVRGETKRPGTIRAIQNWIGVQNCTIEQAKFVPIGTKFLTEGMAKWMDYYHNRSIADPLVQLAVIHLEFEALHPFLDGNGRMGRILIPLFLFERKILSSPNFHMSGYLEANKSQYMSMMRDVSLNGTWTEWCTFFLEGIMQQAEDNHSKVQSILKLRNRVLEEIKKSTRSQFSSNIADILISFPFFDSHRLISSTKMSKSNAAKVLSRLCDDGIVENLQNGIGRRANVYVFRLLLEAID